MPSIEETNKAVLRRYYDGALNGRNLDVIDEVFATTVASHGKEVIGGNDTGPYQDSEWGAEQEKALRTNHLDAFPNAVIEYHLVAEGDIFASRWNAMWTDEETGKKVGPHMHYFYRLEDGKIVEMWYMW